MEEEWTQQRDLVGRRGRFLWKVYHTGCPLFSEVKDCWFLDVCINGRIIICHGLSSKNFASEMSTKLES